MGGEDDNPGEDASGLRRVIVLEVLFSGEEERDASCWAVKEEPRENILLVERPEWVDSPPAMAR